MQTQVLSLQGTLKRFEKQGYGPYLAWVHLASDPLEEHLAWLEGCKSKVSEKALPWIDAYMIHASEKGLGRYREFLPVLACLLEACLRDQAFRIHCQKALLRGPYAGLRPFVLNPFAGLRVLEQRFRARAQINPN